MKMMTMMMMSSSARTLMVMITSLALIQVSTVSARDYVIGDNYGWDIPPGNNSDYYTNWATRYNFQVGDVAVFNWTRDQNHTATRVNREEYDRCDTNVGVRLTGGDGVRVPLETADLHYYICSVDSHCQRGQKIVLNVTDRSSAPSLSRSTALFYSTSLFSATALCFLLNFRISSY